MKIPEAGERFEFYVDLMQKCNATRDDRKKHYNKWRSYFLTGGPANEPATKINKIYSHIEQLCSLMYSSETTRFSVDLAPNASDLHKPQIPALMRAINEEWHLSNADAIFSMALMWSFVDGSRFVKLRIQGTEIESASVSAGDIGVLREDVQGLWRQEAFCHSYYITKSQLTYELEQLQDVPRLKNVLSQIVSAPKPNESSQTTTMDRIVTSASQPSVVGNVNFDLNADSSYRPKVAEELVQMYELYVFDDELKDYRIVTIAQPGIVLFDRPLVEVFIKGEIPIVQICPNPAEDYFWGYSETDKLIPLQDMRNTRMEQITHMLNLQANPPKYGSGFDGAADEFADTMDSPGGLLMANMPGAKLEAMAPKVPEDLYKEIREIDSMFEEMSGITNVIQGKGEQGVRSQGHAANLARLGSSRAKRKALLVEDSLEKLATLFLQLKQAYDPERLQAEDGMQFIPEQFSKDFIVKVDGHSNSPIFMEDQRTLAFELFKAQIIDGESVLELVDIPMKQLLKDRYKVMQAQKAAQAQAQQAAEAKQATLKAVK